jgi:hypothetical protein
MYNLIGNWFYLFPAIKMLSDNIIFVSITAPSFHIRKKIVVITLKTHSGLLIGQPKIQTGKMDEGVQK